MIAIYKYTYWLIHKSAFIQYAHKICHKNLRLLLVYMLYRYKTMWHETTCNMKLISFKNTDIDNINMMLGFIWHSDELNHN